MKTKAILLTAVLGLTSAAANAQLIVFQENMGTAPSTTSIEEQTFENYTGGLSFSGTADVRNTSPSTGYTGASGLGNIWFASNSNRTFTISGINTLGLSGFNLSFGALKTTNAADMSELTVSAGSFPAQPTGSGTSNWREITLTSTTLASSNNASITFTHETTSTNAIRIDDVLLTATKMDRTVTTTASQVIGVTKGTTFGTAPAETQFRLNSDLGGINTSSEVLNLATTADRKLTTSFAASSAAINDLDRLSDVFNLTGTSSDVFVLQLNVSTLDSDAFLGWLDGSNNWTLATNGNTGAGALAGAYTTDFSTFLANNGGTFDGGTMLGAYGNDGSGNVWAVLDHNSSFAIAIPEPGSLILIGIMGVAALLVLRWKKI